MVGAATPHRAEGWPQRSLPVWQRHEVQALLRHHGNATALNALHKVLGTNLNDVEQPAELETPVGVKPQDKRHSRPLDQWSQTVMRNMQRMAIDEDYRTSIAQKLS